jgi:hypothetical protein
MLIQNNDIFSIGSFTGTHDKLPVGTYRLRQNIKTNEYYLVQTEDFVLPHKLYGEFKDIDRILTSFHNTTKNLAALLVGIKGSGKSISAKKLCIDSGLPVIIIDAGYDDVELISFLSSPELGSCVVFIDEYEKLYSEPRNVDETIMLQILDGACNSHHLFLLTVNDMGSFNKNLINRPSRIFYRKTYDGLNENLINEVLEAELINKNWMNEMKEVLGRFSDVTFDILMSLLREVNLYDESPLECAKLMNFSPDSVFVDVVQIHTDGSRRQCTSTTLFGGGHCVELCTYRTSAKDSDYDWTYFKIEDIKRISPTSWELKDEEGHHFVFTKASKYKFLF